MYRHMNLEVVIRRQLHVTDVTCVMRACMRFDVLHEGSLVDEGFVTIHAFQFLSVMNSTFVVLQ